MTLLMLEMVGGAVETLASSLKYKEQNGFHETLAWILMRQARGDNRNEKRFILGMD